MFLRSMEHLKSKVNVNISKGKVGLFLGEYPTQKTNIYHLPLDPKTMKNEGFNPQYMGYNP